MKIAIASSGEDIKSEISRFFGRAPFFVLVDMKDKEITSSEVIENSSALQSGGAGIKTAQLLANEGVDALISFSTGPNAFEILNKLDIKIYKATEGSVEENLMLFKEGKLEEIKSPANAQGGMGRRVR
ncbi:NifB/NifX family molybdenum-iron cluster-binding protein [Methanothermobacter wolfeii]|uniref:NifB/NifX family molybdenum-iron cluster-binding protein n=1 Tax=Methanothermobacter wolfeii TaxID=145261 RepID=UPI0024B36D03|nr:NifB/NifX family molybdenum-iron cluster-binding protein [Methanothermobacter wolfeii]MDI6702145.1 NifB/NifX family molybdenum-iron cluster-binding protein [Methanothermobacter wolfeii]